MIGNSHQRAIDEFDSSVLPKIEQFTKGAITVEDDESTVILMYLTLLSVASRLRKFREPCGVGPVSGGQSCSSDPGAKSPEIPDWRFGRRVRRRLTRAGTQSEPLTQRVR